MSDSVLITPPPTTKNKQRGGRGRVRSTPKGRAVDPKAREDVLALLGDAPRRRDLLIEHLHKIQDRYGCLSARHLVALAAEMKMAMAEVYEVATFYHHFDVVKEGDAAPPAITVRVCDSIACDPAGFSGGPVGVNHARDTSWSQAITQSYRPKTTSGNARSSYRGVGRRSSTRAQS